MLKKERKYFLIAGVLYAILIALIYFGSYLKYLLSYSWYGTAAVIAVIFIWITVFTIATIIAAKGVFLIKERLAGKQRLDFTAWLGVLVAEYSRSRDEIDLFSFFAEICRENGIMDAPDLKKYYDDQNKLIGTREFVYEKLRQEIEDAADKRSKEKKAE